MKPDGTPSAMLADRIEAAAELYRAGKVDKLLLVADALTGADPRFLGPRLPIGGDGRGSWGLPHPA